MKNKSLKSVLMVWQEIVLIIPIVLLFSEITKNRVRSGYFLGKDN